MPNQKPRSGRVPRDYIETIGLADDVVASLRAYEDLVRRWAPRLDLVAPGELHRFETRHLGDSLRALPLVDALPPGPAVDVGSGAGLPGVPLAIAGRPRPWRLLEPRRRRRAFLEEVTRALALERVEVDGVTAEDEARAGRTYVVATARALAPPPETFGRLVPLLAGGGTAIVWVGESAELPPEAGLWRKGIATIPKMDPNRKYMD